MSSLQCLVLLLCKATETLGWLMVYAGMIAIGAVVVPIALIIALFIILGVIIYGGAAIVLLTLWTWVQQKLGGE